MTAQKSGQVDLVSVLTCPHCGSQPREEMPVDACRFFYECPNCRRMLRPLDGDCCVFCSYGSLKCPSKQLEEATQYKLNEEGLT